MAMNRNLKGGFKLRRKEPFWDWFKANCGPALFFLVGMFAIYGLGIAMTGWIK